MEQKWPHFGSGIGNRRIAKKKIGSRHTHFKMKSERRLNSVLRFFEGCAFFAESEPFSPRIDFKHR